MRNILILIGLTFSCISHADSQQTMCSNSSALGKRYAELRNEGVPFKDMLTNIDEISNRNGYSVADSQSAKNTLTLVYTAMNNLPPEQAKKSLYQLFMKAKK